jgi:hypothetical protein
VDPAARDRRGTGGGGKGEEGVGTELVVELLIFTAFSATILSLPCIKLLVLKYH